MQDLIRRRPGVISTRVGYSGGKTDNPTYDTVKTGQTGHAESIEIVFDPSVTSYREMLELFFQIHDPTTVDRQGNDIGDQYRSAIFYLSETQKDVAEDTIADVNASGLWPGQVVDVEVVPAGEVLGSGRLPPGLSRALSQWLYLPFPRPDWVLPKRNAGAA